MAGRASRAEVASLRHLLLPEADTNAQFAFVGIGFDIWLRDQFAKNTGYDKFVRELLTATGETNKNGAANFIVAHPGCRADDVLKLIKIVREKVNEKNRINLESEVKIW